MFGLAKLQTYTKRSFIQSVFKLWQSFRTLPKLLLLLNNKSLRRISTYFAGTIPYFYVFNEKHIPCF